MPTEKIIKIKDTLMRFENGKLLSYKVINGNQITSGYNAFGKTFKTIITRDTTGCIYFEYINDTLVSKTIYFEKHKSHTDSTLFFDGKENLLSKIFYTYDEKGNCVLEQKIEPNEKFADRYKTIIEYKYDEKNNWIEKKVTRKNSGSITWQDGKTEYSDDINYYKRTIIY